MAMVRDALIDEIRERADIVAVCGEYTTLKRTGRTYRGPCPLHGGEGPNFSVDPGRGIFKCFVCGEGGDVFAFVMKHLGFDFPSAIRTLGSQFGVEVPDEEEQREDPHRHLREVVAFAEEWFVSRLEDATDGAAARAYLAGRGISEDDVSRFSLGCAPDGWRGLKEAAAARGISETALLEVGLLATSERTEEPYDRFRGRLIFSIQDLRDRPVAFGGRLLGPGDGRSPKYINSPESPIFHKGRTLYGLSWARHSIRREEYAVLVEGYTDVIALHTRGHDVAVAPLGTALTTDQAELLSRYTSRLYLLYDSDRAGLRATFRAADVLLAAGIHPMVVTLPEGEDPDSLVRSKGGEALETYLADAVDVLERKLQILQRHGYLETIDGRRRAIDGLLSTLRSVRDPALLDLYLGRAAEGTGVRRETLVTEISRVRQTGRRISHSQSDDSPPPARADADPVLAPVGELAAERNVLLLLLRDRTLLDDSVALGLKPSHFRDAGYRALFEAMSEIGPSAALDEVAAKLEADGRILVEALSADSTEIVHPSDTLAESARRLVHRSQLERLDEIDRALRLAEEGQARELLVEKRDLASELREAGVPLSFLRRIPHSGSRV